MTATAARLATVIARSIAPRRPPTVSAWADENRILSSKGSAEPGRWRTHRNPPLREPMDCLSARSPVRDMVLMFPIQFGKALSLDTPLPTPNGWTTMGDVQQGQQVLGDDGRPVRVVAASEVFHDHPCYRVTFSDGAQIVADAGHRWQVVDLARLNTSRREAKRRAASDAQGGAVRVRMPLSTDPAAHRQVLTTDALATLYGNKPRQSRYAVEVAHPLDLPSAALPIDPYLLGVWLGDGSASTGQLSLHEDDAPHILQRIEHAGHAVRARKCAADVARASRCITAIINPRNCGKPTLHGLLVGAGLLGHKHIPVAYLRGSRAQRLALLQGLLDTDGHAGANGSVEITSSLPALAGGIVELARTLGFKPVLRWRRTARKDSARITFMALRSSDVFSVSRKLQALPLAHSERGASAVGMRYITAIERVETVPTRCIAVDNASHLFLCGREFIPTHNTEVLSNALGYTMCENPGPIMVCLPSEIAMMKWVAQKLTPMIDECPAVKRTLTSVASRDAANTRTFKDFDGGQLYIEHAGTPGRLKMTSVRTLLVDELDEFATSLSSGDDPVAMLDGRTSAFPATFKRAYISTPGIQGLSRTMQLWEKSDQRRYYVPCPDCGHKQPLDFRNGLHFTPDGSQCWYVCRHCGVLIEEHQKTAMIAAGEWVAENPAGTIRGYTINCLYYQLGLGPRWLDIVQMWRDAQNDKAKLKTFINDRLAEPWDDPAMRAVKHNLIADRAEPLPLRPMPAWVLALTVGIDTQDNRLAVHLLGWGRGMTCWPVDYIELLGDPAEDAVWDALTDLLLRPVDRIDGVQLRLDAGLIDIGGHRGEAVKAFVRRRVIRRLLAGFGATANNAQVLGKGKLVDINWRGQSDKRGVHIHQVGTVAIKHLLYSWLSADADKDPEHRRIRFSDQLSQEYFGGLVSETYNPAKNRFEKKRGGPRNEPLDTWVYAYAATHHPELRLHRWTKADWDRRESMLLARTSSPKSEATHEQTAQDDADSKAGIHGQRRRRPEAKRSSFATNY